MKSLVTSARPADDPHFRGFTFNEIKLRRAFVLMKGQLERDEITMKARSMVKSADGRLAGLTGGSGVLTKVAGSLNYFDYAYLGFTLVSKVLKLVKRVRGRKR